MRSFTPTPSLSTSNHFAICYLSSGSHYSRSIFICNAPLPFLIKRLSSLTSHSSYSVALKPKGTTNFSNAVYTFCWFVCFLFGSFSLGVIFLIFSDSFCMFFFLHGPTSSGFCNLSTCFQHLHLDQCLVINS